MNQQQYSDLLNRQKEELEKLDGERYNDVEKLRIAGRPYDEIRSVHEVYQVRKADLLARQTQERQVFFKPLDKAQEKGNERTDEVQRILDQFRDNQKNGKEQGFSL